MRTKKIIIILIALTISLSGFAQRLVDKSGKIHIYSATSLFTIEAENNKVASILDLKTGDLVVSTLVLSFKFHEALVEEHFNENYMESKKFPKASFKGKILNHAGVDFSKDGVYPGEFEGDLTMHGVTNHIKSKGVITVKNGKISAKSTIKVSLAGYKIKVEESYKDRIKDEIILTISFNYTPMTK